jgi:hypothetical protein
MSESIQHIQFGEEIQPARTTASKAYTKDLASFSEKSAGVDLEERAVQIANEDLNHKKKQVWKSPQAPSLNPKIFRDLHRMGFDVVGVPKYRCKSSYCLSYISKVLIEQQVIYGDIGTSPLYGTYSYSCGTICSASRC